MNLQSWIGVVLLAAFLSFVVAGSNLRVVSANHTYLEISPNPLFLTPGGNDVLDLWVRGLDDSDQLGSYNLTLSFDPNVIRIDSVVGGDAPFDSTPDFTVDTTKGEVTVIATPSTGEPSKEARIARLNVTAVGALDDSSPITFTSAELTDGTNQPISAAAGDGGSVNIASTVVRVGSASVAQGRSTTVPVTVSFSPSGGLAGYNISIDYDSAIIKIDGILSGDAPFGGTPIFNINEAESFVNVVGFHGDRPGPVGRTVVMNMTVTGIAKGTSGLGLTVKDLVDAENADSWTAAAVDGLVRVLAASSNVGSTVESALASSSSETGKPVVLEGAVLVDLTPGVLSQLSLPNQKATLTFPIGSVTERGFAAMKQIDAEATPSPPSGFSHGTVIEVNMLDLSGNLLYDVFLSKQATISMSLPDASRITSDIVNISIQRYEPVLGRWLALPTTVDHENMVAIAEVDRLSIFALTIDGTIAAEASSSTTSDGSAVSGDSPATPSDDSAPLGGTDQPDGGGIPAWVIVLIVVGIVALSATGYFVSRPKRIQSRR
ncbi:MAG: hypothetical protein IIA92_04750 [Chloroflexi bacterium]|nr:hypothetical protein [Chloroflexota bacterium]